MRRLAVLLLVLGACGRKSAPSPSPSPSPAPSAIAPGAVPAAATAASLGPVAGKGAVTYVAREFCRVPVDGVDETWTLRWRGPPRRESGSKTEEGSLEIVRARSGAPAETLLLDPFFDDGVAKLFDYPMADAVLRPELGLESCGRVMMDFGDYDHDGRATEFVVTVARETNFHWRRPSIVVGISHANPHLHAFGPRRDPTHPLVLADEWDWEGVKDADGETLRLMAKSCKDGAKYDEILTVRSIGGELDVTRKKERCR